MTTTKIKKAAIAAIEKYGIAEIKTAEHLIYYLEPVTAGLVTPEEIPEEVAEICCYPVGKGEEVTGVMVEGAIYTEEGTETMCLKTVPVGKEVIKMLEGLIKGALEKGLILK